MNWSVTGAVLLALAVVFGAFGAHALREQLTASAMLTVYEKAVFYHFIHALGLLVASILLFPAWVRGRLELRRKTKALQEAEADLEELSASLGKIAQPRSASDEEVPHD